MKIVLASGSPRRRQLLEIQGFELTIRPPDIDEALRPGEAPADHVLRLAREKASAIGAQGELVVAADTVVELDGELLGKPASVSDAREHLHRLSGRVHQVLSGYCVRRGEHERSGVVISAVEFRALTAATVEAYLASAESLDKAGGYGIQGLGSGLVRTVHGSFSNVVGLPLDEVLLALSELGAALPE